MSATLYQPSADFVKNAHISGMPAYQALCKEAETDYEAYWVRLAKEFISWKTPFTKVLDESKAPFFKWFELVFLAKVHPDASAKVRQEQHTGINNDVTNNLLDYVCTLAWHHFLEKDVDGLKKSSEVPHS